MEDRRGGPRWVGNRSAAGPHEEAVPRRDRAARFAKQWLDARRLALNENERLAEHLYRALNQVFYALDEYPIDPAFREDGDTTDAELLDIVNQTLERIGGTGD